MAASAPTTFPSPRSLGLLRALRAVTGVVLGLLAAIGAVTTPLASLLLSTLFAALAWKAVRALHRSATAGLPPLPHPAMAAMSAALLPPAVGGTAVLGLGLVGVVAWVFAVVGALGWWSGSCPAPQPHPAGPDDGPETDDGSLHDLLRVVPLDTLLEEWRSTAEPAVSVGGEAGTRNRLRRMLIAELRWRDPAGTERWLCEAPEAPPDGYVQGTGDRAA
jgi:hypothetical protein